MKKLAPVIISCLLSFTCLAHQHPTKHHNTAKHHQTVGHHHAATNSSLSVETKIHNIAKKTNTVIGVTAIHIETDKRISYNGSVPNFMASTAKVPIALTLLHRVDNHEESLNHIVELGPNNSVPGSGSLRSKLDKGKIYVPVKTLLILMLIHSDNSASDALLHLDQGPAGVKERLQALGFHNIHVDRGFLQIFMDTHGVSRSVLDEPHTSEKLQTMFEQVHVSKKILARSQLEKDGRDTTTPEAMAVLLSDLYKGKLLSPTNTKLLLSTMAQCRTGRSRIKGLLPINTIVAHKTGTWSLSSKTLLQHPASHQFARFTSDVGIITLPGNKGHVAIAVYVKSNAYCNSNRSRVIAEVSKIIYDHFMGNTHLSTSTTLKSIKPI